MPVLPLFSTLWTTLHIPVLSTVALNSSGYLLKKNKSGDFWFFMGLFFPRGKAYSQPFSGEACSSMVHSKSRLRADKREQTEVRSWIQVTGPVEQGHLTEGAAEKSVPD